MAAAKAKGGWCPGCSWVGGLWVFGWMLKGCSELEASRYSGWSLMLWLGWGRWGVVCWQWYLRFAVELLVVVDPTLVVVVLGWLVLVLWDRKANHSSLFSSFVRILAMVVSFGLISPYFYEVGCWGFGLKVLLLLCCYSRGLIVLISLCFCGQFANKRSLHVIWYNWSMVLKEGVCHSDSWLCGIIKTPKLLLGSLRA